MGPQAAVQTTGPGANKIEAFDAAWFIPSLKVSVMSVLTFTPVWVSGGIVLNRIGRAQSIVNVFVIETALAPPESNTCARTRTVVLFRHGTNHAHVFAPFANGPGGSGR